MICRLPIYHELPRPDVGIRVDSGRRESNDVRRDDVDTYVTYVSWHDVGSQETPSVGWAGNGGEDKVQNSAAKAFGAGSQKTKDGKREAT